MNSFDPNSLSDTLKLYYKRLFPYKTYCLWLQYGDSSYFQRREFAFVLPSDSYLRFRCFNNQIDLEKELQQLMPSRIELGAVYNYRPKDGRGKTDFMAVERELVFDIDLNDYDDVRKCCASDGMCKKCWQFIIIASKIINAAIAEDFGFDHRLWVYSGRRGIHCWVCDTGARKLSQEARAAIVDYLTVITGGDLKTKKVTFPADAEFHPSIKRAIDIILQHFPTLAEGQGWFDNAEAYEFFLSLLTRENIQNAVRIDFESRDSSLTRAQAVVNRLQKRGYGGDNKLLTEAVLQLAYPRLDVNVSKTINHLLKTPFSVHPKTGKICVPLDDVGIEKFDPDGAPRVDVLYDETLSLSGKKPGAIATIEAESSTRKSLDYKRTSMAVHVRVFENFVYQLQDSAGEKSECMEVDEEA